MSGGRAAVEAEGLRNIIRVMFVFVAVVFGMFVMVTVALMRAPDKITVDVMPNVHQGGTLRPGEVQLATVHAFALETWTALNRWPQNGAEDYWANMVEYQDRVTPSFLEWLKTDYREKSGEGRRGSDELTHRVRTMTPIYGWHVYQEDAVDVHQRGASWTVEMRLALDETSGGVTVKSGVAIRYRMRVVRTDIEKGKNPWGLALDGWPISDRPKALEPMDAATVSSKPTAKGRG